jgi:hypothetical protein
MKSDDNASEPRVSNWTLATGTKPGQRPVCTGTPTPGHAGAHSHDERFLVVRTAEDADAATLRQGEPAAVSIPRLEADLA